MQYKITDYDNITGRAHFISSAAMNPNFHHRYPPIYHNAYAHQYYSHIGYDPNRYRYMQNTQQSNFTQLQNANRKRIQRSWEDYSSSEEAINTEDDTLTDDDDDDDTLTDDDMDDDDSDDDIYSPSNNKRSIQKRKKLSNERQKKRRRISTNERRRQYDHYMKQFEGIEEALNELKHIEPDEGLKQTRKKYMIDSCVKLEVEQILHRREFVDEVTGMPKYECYVQWKYLSYIHCEWISEGQLLKDRYGSQKLKRFLKKGLPFWKNGTELIEPQWTIVDRILAGRPGYASDYFIVF